MKKETKREKIIRAAVQLLRPARNINKVSIEDIAREAGVSPTTIYNNFGDKETLLIEVIKQIGDDAVESYRKIIRADIPFPDKIQQVVRQKMAAASEMDWSGIFKLLAQDPRLAEYTEKVHVEEVRSNFIELIEDGRRQGYIEPDLSVEAILLYLDFLREGSGLVSRIPREIRENTKIMQDLNDIVFHGFVNRNVT
ncbi:TetR/AcrR family transcriptional regulator [Chloroflexota bacterium]